MLNNEFDTDNAVYTRSQRFNSTQTISGLYNYLIIRDDVINAKDT